jgi:RND family efflux transporter MFP subunit
MNARTRFVHRLLGLVLLGVAANPATAQDDDAGMGGPPPTPVNVVEVRAERVQAHRAVTGELRTAKRSNVASLEGGRVTQLLVREGDVVRAGDTLATLDDRRLVLQRQRIESDVLVKKAVLAEREAQLDQAMRDEAKLRRMLDDASATENEYADAVTTRVGAQARCDQARAEIIFAEAELALIRQRIEDATIVAPFNATVVRRHTEIGEWIGEGEAVVELIARDRLEAWLDVPERFSRTITGDGVRLLVEIVATDERVEGEPRIIWQVDTTARSFSAVVDIDEAGRALAPGMSVRAWVPTGVEEELLLVPRDALMQNEAGFFVYIVRQGTMGMGEVAMPTTVRVAFPYRDSVAVHPGAIQPGDRVVVEGNERLFPMAPVIANLESANENVAAAAAASTEGED